MLEKQKKDVSAFSDVSDTGKSSSFKTSSTLSSSLGTGSSKEEGKRHSLKVFRKLIIAG